MSQEGFMFFDLFQFGPDSHLKRAEVLLHEAQIARIEHQAAAEHHGALARMYAERVRRLEIEVVNQHPAIRTATSLATKPQEEHTGVYSLGEKRLSGLPAIS